MKLELVLDPHQSTHRRMAQRLQDSLAPGEQLHLHALADWVARGSRWPGEAIPAPITVLLAPPAAAAGAGLADSMPSRCLLLAEWSGEQAWAWGASSGVQPLLARNPRSSLAILRRQATAEGAGLGTPQLECLVQASLPTLARWPRQHERLLDAAADYLLSWLRQCDQRHHLLRICPRRNVRFSAAVPLTPRRQLQAHAQWTLQGVRRRLDTSLAPSDRRWRIAVGRVDGSESRISLHHHLEPDASGWYADPFLIQQGEHTWLFCEQWNTQLRRGVIALFEVTRQGIQPRGTVLEEPFHLSFPRVVQHHGQWYATVESTEHQDVRLYEAVRFPYSWRLCRLLLTDAPWADPLLLHRNDGWFLLASTCSSRAIPRETAPDLHLFHSHDLLKEPFRPHPCSPLMLDSQSGRNGGAFHLHGHLYRVAQQTGFNDAYGKGLELHRIAMLTPTAYQERREQPDWLLSLQEQLPASHMHSLSVAQQWISVDYRPGPR